LGGKMAEEEEKRREERKGNESICCHLYPQPIETQPINKE